jgi:hypothetical protein
VWLRAQGKLGKEQWWTPPLDLNFALTMSDMQGMMGPGRYRAAMDEWRRGPARTTTTDDPLARADTQLVSGQVCSPQMILTVLWYSQAEITKNRLRPKRCVGQILVTTLAMANFDVFRRDGNYYSSVGTPEKIR